MRALFKVSAAWMVFSLIFAVSGYPFEARLDQQRDPKNSQDDQPLSMEDALREAVFKYQILRATTQENDYVFFLSVNGADPSDALFKRFADHPAVKKVSESFVKEYEGVVDEKTGKKGTILSVDSIKWISDTAAEVEGVHYTAPLAASGHVYKVRLEEGKWAVKDDDMKWIS